MSSHMGTGCQITIDGFPVQNQDVADRLDYLGHLDAASEIRRLRKDNEDLERIMTDLCQDSTAFMRGMDAGSRDALRKIIHNLSSVDKANEIMRAVQYPEIQLKPEELVVRCGKVEITGELDDLSLKVDGREMRGVALRISLKLGKMGGGYEPDKDALIAELRAEADQLKNELKLLRAATARRSRRPMPTDPRAIVIGEGM